MALNDTFVKNVKPCKPKGEKYADGEGMYLLVTPGGKYWRFDYRYLGKRKTLALALLADGIDPSLEKKREKQRRFDDAIQTFETVARTWLIKTAAERAPTTQVKVTGWLKKDAFPHLGNIPIAAIKPRDVLLAVQRMEARGAVESAHRVRQICGQVFRFAVAAGLVERDVTADLKGALASPKKTHYAAITTPKQTALFHAVKDPNGRAYNRTAAAAAGGIAPQRSSTIGMDRPDAVGHALSPKQPSMCGTDVFCENSMSHPNSETRKLTVQILLSEFMSRGLYVRRQQI